MNSVQVLFKGWQWGECCNLDLQTSPSDNTAHHKLESSLYTERQNTQLKRKHGPDTYNKFQLPKITTNESVTETLRAPVVATQLHGSLLAKHGN